MTAMVTKDGNGAATEATDDASAMVLSKDPTMRRELEPHTLDALYKMAAAVAKIGLCGVSSPEEAMVRMLTGRELGLTQMQALRGVYVVEGNPSLSASVKQSICLAHPNVCEEFRLVESTNEIATYRVKRRGQPARDFSWTIDDAKRAQLLDRGKDPAKNNWNRYPRRMLQARAKSEAADVTFGDLLHGFPTREDLEDDRRAIDVEYRVVPDAKPAPSPVSAAVRDFDAECVTLTRQIEAAKTKGEKRAAREAVAKWDGGEPWAGALKETYNKHHATKAAAAPPPPPSSTPATREPGEEG